MGVLMRRDEIQDTLEGCPVTAETEVTFYFLAATRRSKEGFHPESRGSRALMTP